MSLGKERGITIDVLAGLLICGGAYFFFARPLTQEAAQMRARAETLVAQGFGQRTGAGTSGLSDQQYKDAARELADTARGLHSRGRSAFNEAGMLTALTALATAHNMQLDQLQPVPGRAVRKSVPVDPAAPPPPDDREIGYTFTVRGEYESLVAFLRSLSENHAHTCVVSLRVSPSQEAGSPPVIAVVSTRHWAFDVLAASRIADAALASPE
jgi:hypothetical protein